MYTVVTHDKPAKLKEELAKLKFTNKISPRAALQFVSFPLAGVMRVVSEDQLAFNCAGFPYYALFSW